MSEPQGLFPPPVPAIGSVDGREQVQACQVFKHRKRDRWVEVLDIDHETGYATIAPTDSAGAQIPGRQTRIKLESDGCGLVYYTRDLHAEGVQVRPGPAAGWEIRRRQILHRRRDNTLATVGYINPGTGAIRVTPVDAQGFAHPTAHAYNLTPQTVYDRYQLYRPCRWDLHCLAQADTVVHHSSGDIDACTPHAAEHQPWAALDPREQRNEIGPDPACWCADEERLYGPPSLDCPLHGPAEERGSELSADDLAPNHVEGKP